MRWSANALCKHRSLAAWLTGRRSRGPRGKHLRIIAFASSFPFVAARTIASARTRAPRQCTVEGFDQRRLVEGADQDKLCLGPSLPRRSPHTLQTTSAGELERAGVRPLLVEPNSTLCAQHSLWKVVHEESLKARKVERTLAFVRDGAVARGGRRKVG